MDVALCLIPRQGFREQVSSIVDTSDFLELQVTLGCFLLVPQIIGVQTPQFASPRRATIARAALASPSTTPFFFFWCEDMMFVMVEVHNEDSK